MVQYQQLPYRFVNITVYILAALVNSLPVHTFSSINSATQKAFNYSKQAVTANALIFTILHPVGAFPANWILDRYGSQIGCIMGSIFVIAGVWLRTLMDYDSPQWCIVGSVLAAWGNLFVLNSAVKIAVNWFNMQNAPNIIFLSVLANQISMTLGAAAPGLILSGKDQDGKARITIQEIKDLVFWEALVITIPLVLLIILYRDKPSVPPSKAASKTPKKQKYTVLLKRLFSNTQYMKILAAMTCSYGTVIAFMATLDPLLASLKYGDSSKVTADTILWAMIVGIFATPIFSILLKKTKKYKLITELNILGCYIAFGAIVYLFVSGEDNPAIISVFAGLAGFFLIPNLSLYIAYGAQAAFPIGEGSAGGYLFAAGQTFGFFLGFVMISVIDENKSAPSHWCFIIFEFLIAASLIFIVLTKQDLKRQKYEQNLKRSSIGEETPQIEAHLQDSLIVPDNSGYKQAQTQR